MNAKLPLPTCLILGVALVSMMPPQLHASTRTDTLSLGSPGAEQSATAEAADPLGLPPPAGAHVFRIEDRAAAEAAGLKPTHREGWYAVPDAELDEDAPKARAARALASYSTPAFLDLFEELSWPNPAIFIGFEPGATPKERATALAAAGGVVQQYSHLPDLVLVHVDATSGTEVLARVAELSRLPRVAFVEPDMAFTGRALYLPNDEFFPVSWGHLNTGQSGGLVGFDMRTSLAWDLGTGSPDVSVLVFETGVQPDHPDLNQIPGRDFTTGAVDGIPGGGPTNPNENHGTPVAGCISGRINNSIGGCGVAPGCPTVSARTFVGGSGGSWTANMSWSVNALNWAIANGTRITNNSNQYGNYFTGSVSSAYAATRAAGAVHFAGAGNFGSTEVRFPGNDPSVLTVGASAWGGFRQEFSSFGPLLDFLAPGIYVPAADRTGGDGYNTTDYTAFSGTSAASPVAAGVAALMRSRNPAISPDEITAILHATARDMGAPGFDTETGWGMLDAAAAVAAVVPSTYEPCNAFNPILDVAISSLTLNQATASDLDLGGSSCAFTIRKANFFKFTPPLTGIYAISTCPGGVDTRMAIVTDCASPAETLLACAEGSSCGSPAAITLSLAGGASVYVVVGAAGEASLPSRLAVSIATPTNPACLAATTAVFGDNAINTTASISPQLVKSNSSGTATVAIYKATWFAFKPVVTGAYKFKTCGASGDTKLAIGTACPGIGARFEGIAYNDIAPNCFTGTNPWAAWIDATNNGASGTYAGFPLTQDLVAGTTYYICVGGFSALTGNITGFLTIDGPPQPPLNPADLNGDGFVNAADLAMLLSAWGLPGAADIDGDGTAGAPDLGMLLNAWTG